MANNTESKWINVGSIVRNEKDGKQYEQLILNKEFLEDAKNITNMAYLDKNGGRRFSLFKPSDKAPDYVLYNVSVKKT